jgi:hypothetical protein
MAPFQLRDARDLLEKLQWEINNLFFRQRYDIAVCAYHVFNCAVTAWHVTDWLWRDLEARPDVLANIRQGTGCALTCRKDFQDYVSAHCARLDLCRQVANGSKHSGFAKDIAATVSGGEGDNYGNPIISDGNTDHPAHKVFYAALFWYRGFLHNWNVFPEEPFVPKGDPDGPPYPRLKLRR